MSVLPLLPYDPKSKCTKCGGDMVSTEYRLERMWRRCFRCGYSWSEAPLDSGAKP